MDPEKIEAIMSWPAPRKVTHVRPSMGLARHYKKFTEGYSIGRVEYMYGLRMHACEPVVP